MIDDDELKRRLSDPGLTDQDGHPRDLDRRDHYQWRTRLTDLGRLSNEANNATQLDIDMEDVRCKTGTLLAVDALDQTPTRSSMVIYGYLPSDNACFDARAATRSSASLVVPARADGGTVGRQLRQRLLVV